MGKGENMEEKMPETIKSQFYLICGLPRQEILIIEFQYYGTHMRTRNI